MSLFYRVGAVSGASAILLGAFGAHALKGRVTDTTLLKTWETAASYHLLCVSGESVADVLCCGRAWPPPHALL